MMMMVVVVSLKSRHVPKTMKTVNTSQTNNVNGYCIAHMLYVQSLKVIIIFLKKHCALITNVIQSIMISDKCNANHMNVHPNV